MKSAENILKICSSLQSLGLPIASEKIMEALSNSHDDPLAIVTLALDLAATTESNIRYEKCLRIAKLGNPVFLSELYTYKVRQLDLEYI